MNDSKHRCQFTVEETVAMVLLGRPFTTLKATEPAYRELANIPAEQAYGFVLENTKWNVGYDNIALPELPDGEFRLWNKKDWEICDNHRNNTIARLNKLHEERIAKRKEYQANVKAHLISNKVTEDVANMLIATLNDEQLAEMVKTIQK